MFSCKLDHKLGIYWDLAATFLIHSLLKLTSGALDFYRRFQSPFRRIYRLSEVICQCSYFYHQLNSLQFGIEKLSSCPWPFKQTFRLAMVIYSSSTVIMKLCYCQEPFERIFQLFKVTLKFDFDRPILKPAKKYYSNPWPFRQICQLFKAT
jgi:hypothetical protein